MAAPWLAPLPKSVGRCAKLDRRGAEGLGAEGLGAEGLGPRARSAGDGGERPEGRGRGGGKGKG